MAQILRAAGVDFAILGEEESCNAEWARRGGEEYLYQVQAEENVETLKQYKFKRIVTQCPHCYNTLENEYPQFGGEWLVSHHTQFIQELIAADRLEMKGDWDQIPERRATYHDSCYLGRYNQVYEAPRQVLSSVPGLQLTELGRSQDQGFFCGAGGSCMWMERKVGQRINDVRVDEIQGLGADLAAVACPFCLTMLDECVTARHAQDSLALCDIAELVATALA
jgi:Fe-S oxidoreductase